VLLVSGQEPATTEELARGLTRAGFATVSWERAARGIEDIGRVRDALFAGVLGVGVHATSYVLLGEGQGGLDAGLCAAADARVRALVTLDAEPGDTVALGEAQKVPCPWLVLRTEGREDARERPALAGAAQPQVTVRVVRAGPESSTRDPDRALRIIVDWLARLV
jgi:hypothetical protein